VFEYSSKRLWRVISMDVTDDDCSMVLSSSEYGAKVMASKLDYNYGVKPKRVK